jgi:predicted secreted protein
MPDSVLCVALFILWWWLAFFAMLPIGVRNASEEGAPVEAGNDAGAPVAANVKKKALWATGAAAVLWVITIVLIIIDPFNMRPDIPH